MPIAEPLSVIGSRHTPVPLESLDLVLETFFSSQFEWLRVGWNGRKMFLASLDFSSRQF